MTSVDIPLKTFLKKRSNGDSGPNALALNDFRFEWTAKNLEQHRKAEP